MNNGILSVLHEENLDIEELILMLPEPCKKQSIEVAEFTAKIVKWAEDLEGINNYNIDEVKRAVKFHDVGMSLLPSRILKKKTELTAEEFKVIEKHTLYGSKFINNFRVVNIKEEKEQAFWRLAAELALSHHERWDGKGYPNGEKATATILPARALAIAGTFYSMIQGSVYRMPLPSEFALFEIIHNGGKQFDPTLTKLLKNNCDEILLQISKHH